ncbi:MAG TPA: metallophosphoesterase family protein [Candidatus Sulfotelmatobacter sp.]|jgi:putative phosphoesterase|nr:metallophosphoesterase family protein [Candidatus Sulfotelmatobacter sp.]
MRIGIISDTHGLLRPEAQRALLGVDLIIHAGDVGTLEILTQLKGIAPVVAVRGNVDTQSWAQELPLATVVQTGGFTLYVLHNLADLDLKPQAVGLDAVISGHTHQPEQRFEAGVLYLNPGSAGPRRFNLPVTLALLELSKKPWKAEIVPLLAT